MQQAEQEARRLPAGSHVDSRGLQLQQDLTMMQQQLHDEEVKLQQLTQTLASFQQKAALVNNPTEAASTQAR